MISYNDSRVINQHWQFDIASTLKRFFLRQAFNPSVIGILINPFYIARNGLHECISALAPMVKGRVLDVGCGNKPYRDLFNCSEYVGLEVARSRDKSADVFYDGRLIPFEDSSFDNVVTNQVLEHVFDPDQFLSQIHRVLKPGGGLLLTVPFVWDEHEQPFDYARYSSFGLKRLLEKNGFEVVEQRKTVQDIRVIFQLLNCYLHKQTSSWHPIFKAIAWLAFSGPINIAAELAAKLLPSNADLFLDNIVFARKVTAQV